MVIPAECRLDPVEPAQREEPALPAPVDQPASSDGPVKWLEYERNRRIRAEIAGLHYRGERNDEREARLENAVPQAACARWARRERGELAGQ